MSEESNDESGLDSVLAAKQLSYQYGNFCVWKDIELELLAGEIAFLLGANGSGKTTLLRCLAGWTAPKTGSITLNGESLAGAKRNQRSQIIFILDAPIFYDDLTAQEHIDFILKANRKESLLENATRLMMDFGLTQYQGVFPSSYSRGMKVKLALVLGLMLEPGIFLLDEPYGALDSDAAWVLSQELQAASARGATVIISCHHPISGLLPDKVFHLHDDKLDILDASSLRDFWPNTCASDGLDEAGASTRISIARH